MAITISGENNNDRITAQDGVIDTISGFNIAGIITASSFTGDLTGDVTGNLTGNVTGNINNSTLLLQTGGTERVRITSTGQVQINRDGGSGALTLGASQDFKFYHDAGGPTIFSDGGNQGLKLQIKELNLTEYTGVTTKLKIASDGKIGIGNISSPVNNVEIRTDAHGEGITIRSTGNTSNALTLDANRGTQGVIGVVYGRWNGTTVAQMNFVSGDDGTDKNDGYITFGTESAASNGNVNATERLRITSAGDVAIGRDAALSNYAAGSTTTKLAVTKDSAGSGYHEIAHFTAGTDSNDTGAIVRITQFNNDRGLYIKAGRGTSDQAKAIFGLRNSANSDSDVMTFIQGGKVGINEDNPAYPLEVVGDGGGSFAASSNSTNGVLSIVGKNSGGSISAISRIKSYPEGSSNQSHMAFETRTSANAMTEALRISATQQVGIGTDNPQEILHVNKNTGTACILVSSSTAPQIRFNPNATDGSDGDRSILGQATGNSQFVNSAVSGDTILRGTSSGSIKFGIGNDEKVRITSSGNLEIINNNDYLKIGNGGALSMVFTGGQSYITNSTGHLTGRSASYTWENLDGSAEYARITSGGNLTLGTSVSNERVHIHTASSLKAQQQFTNTTTGTGAGDGLVIGITGGEEAIFWNQEDTDMTFATDNTERLRITGSGVVSFDAGTTAAVTPSQTTATSIGHQTMSGGASWFNHGQGTDYFGVDGDWKLTNGATYGKIVARNTQGAISNAEQAGHTWFMVCKTVAGTLGNSNWVVEPVAGWKMAWPHSLAGGATATFYMRDAVESFGSPTIPASGDYYIGWFYSVSQDMGTNGGAYYVDANSGGKIYYYSSEGDLSNPHQRIPRQGDSWDAINTGEKIHFRFETLPKADLTGTVFASPLLVDPVMQGVPLIDGLPMAGGQLVKDVQWATNVSSVEFQNADFVNCNYLVTYSINGSDGSNNSSSWFQTRLQFCDHDGIYKTGTNDYISHCEWNHATGTSPSINSTYAGYQRSIWLTGNGANYDHEGYVWIIPSNFRHNRNATISQRWGNNTEHEALTHPRIFVRGHSHLSAGVDNAHYREEGGGTYRGSNDIFTLSGFRLYGSADSNFHTPASNGSSNGYVRIWRFKSGFEAREVS